MRAMATLLHLSDVHLRDNDARQEKILESLSRALNHEFADRKRRVDLIVVTGDVFDSSTLELPIALRLFNRLVEILRRTLGKDVPIIVQPGNHDRRDSGVLGPHDRRLFDSLAGAAPPDVHVTGVSENGLAHVFDAIFAIPARLVAFDSTFLPTGWISAGGWMRSEDLLRMASLIADDDPGQPLILLLHHHLIPTPLTDSTKINVAGRNLPTRLAIRKILPSILANGDREELTMTALGAGGALSLLQSLGRPVLVMHGHKHYPTVRVLTGPSSGEGDVILASAGSAGTSEPWCPDDADRAAALHLWPSFNVVTLEGAKLQVETVFFSDKDSTSPPRRRPLVDATRAGARWKIATVNVHDDFEVRIERNASEFKLLPNETTPRDAHDLVCTRTIVPALAVPALVDYVQGLGDGVCEWTERGEAKRTETPADVTIEPGVPTTYRVVRAVAARSESAARYDGPGTAYEWVGQLNRYGTRNASLSLSARQLPELLKEAFGSVTDLNTGRETPARLTRSDAAVTMNLENCPPRSLLRIYWPLPRAE
ncbi:MAG: metallophosphoesterase family protein [Polyangiales bacterium]